MKDEVFNLVLMGALFVMILMYAYIFANFDDRISELEIKNYKIISQEELINKYQTNEYRN